MSTMRILYIHQYFITPATEGGTRSYEFARYLTRQGHEVTMICSGIRNKEFPVEEHGRIKEYHRDGIRILSIAAGYHDARAATAMSGWRRMIHFHSFASLATEIGKIQKKPDVIFATHTPLTVGLTGHRLARHFEVPFVFEVRDLWPDALVNIGALTNPLGIWYLRRMERRIYRRADHIIALSPGMKEGVLKQGIPDQKVTVIPNSSDLELFNPRIDGADPRRRLELGDRFAAIYFGAMGLANGLDYAVDAAKLLHDRGRSDIAIVLHGEGKDKVRLKERAHALRLKNVVFSDIVPRKSDMARIVAGCDACLTIYRASKEVTWSPNKLFDALAAGKPALINVGQWLGEIVTENECGYAVHPERPESLADALIDLADHPEKARAMGQNARKVAEEQFDRKKLAARLEQVLLQATGPSNR
ncbi:MAG: glycosyltransferase family 4 protein [Phycisphaeraceae bacterium]|nr:glycosyltransferase family 4 protein [Phycisphaeraceae bacterium]